MIFKNLKEFALYVHGNTKDVHLISVRQIKAYKFRWEFLGGICFTEYLQEGGQAMNIVKKAKNGSSDAFIQLIEDNKTSLYKVARSYLKNDEDVADAISETVLIAYEKLYQLKNDRYFKTWLIRILINQCKQMYEKNKKYQLTDEVVEIGEYDSNYSNIEFDELLSELPEKDRILFILRYSEGYTTKQIADMLDMNENTVVSRLGRGRKKIRTGLRIVV